MLQHLLHRFSFLVTLLVPFEVKHIVTVGEPLGCALANRYLIAISKCIFVLELHLYGSSIDMSADTWKRVF